MIGEQGRVLGVDPGTVRVGLAISDPLGLTAQPLEPLQVRGMRDAAASVGRVAVEHGAARIVIGLPLHLSGAEGERAQAARELARRLRGALRGVVVELWDERLTSAEASRVLGASRGPRRAGRVDTVAAQLILQSYLDAGGGEARGA